MGSGRKSWLHRVRERILSTTLWLEIGVSRRVSGGMEPELAVYSTCIIMITSCTYWHWSLGAAGAAAE